MATATKLKIKVGDTVQVLTGKDAGRRGKVIRAIPERSRVVVEGINIVKRHTKPRPPANPQQASRQQSGGVIEQEAAVHVSSVALICPERDRPARVGYRIKEDGRKVRVARIAGKAVDIDR